MFGITILDHADVFCKNDSVYKNTVFSESILKKKNKSILFHHVRDCVTAGIVIVNKVHTK